MWLHVLLSSCTLDQSQQGDELRSNPLFSFTVSNPTCQVANGFEFFHSSTKDSFPLSSLIRSWAAIFSACWRRMISVGIVRRPWCYIRKYETLHLRNINPLRGKNRHGGAINTAAFPFALRCRTFLDASRAHACANMLYDIAIACHVSHSWMFLQETCILLRRSYIEGLWQNDCVTFTSQRLMMPGRCLKPCKSVKTGTTQPGSWQYWILSFWL